MIQLFYALTDWPIRIIAQLPKHSWVMSANLTSFLTKLKHILRLAILKHIQTPTLRSISWFTLVYVLFFKADAVLSVVFLMGQMLNHCMDDLLIMITTFRKKTSSHCQFPMKEWRYTDWLLGQSNIVYVWIFTKSMLFRKKYYPNGTIPAQKNI